MKTIFWDVDDTLQNLVFEWLHFYNKSNSKSFNYNNLTYPLHKCIGCTKDEILDSLGGDPNVTYKSIKQVNAPHWLIGNINTTYDTLIKLFGNPKKEDWIGNNFIWILQSNNNKQISIYDNGTDLEPDELKKIEYNWYIGGTNKQDANDLISYIYHYTI